ncbi:MAG: hypothetical protein QOJ63_440 [Solirubrobacteraceae bacterium]|nr:hypothetical protein [Solirubrobacteraceae bacterium]
MARRIVRVAAIAARQPVKGPRMLPTTPRALVAVLLCFALVVAGCGSGSDAPKNLDATVRVVDAKPAGGVQSLDVTKGGRVHLVVQSDTADEIHIHGYDIHKDVARNGKVTFDFTANIDGGFVIELEEHKQQIANLKVEP